ncbi:MAG TPA: cytochrome c, partial [Chloroflexaceae bacterium]|nr:cytochrome c [Chloroflexaceae bacterium]
LALAFIAMAGLVFVTGVRIGATGHTLSPTGEAQAQLPPEPRLEQNPNVDGERIIAAAVAQLEGYGWVDQGQGSAHIPIERAKELLLERGVANAFAGGQAGGAPAAPAPTSAPAAGGPVEFDAELAAQGEQIFANIGCAACHRGDGAGIGPSLEGLYNRERPLADGGTVLADEAYLIESILNPTARVAEGYQPVMPPYEGQLSDDQVAQLVEYIKSLAQ